MPHPSPSPSPIDIHVLNPGTCGCYLMWLKNKNVFTDVIKNLQNEDLKLSGRDPNAITGILLRGRRNSQTGKRRKWCEWRRESLNDAKLLALKMEDEDVSKGKQEMQPWKWTRQVKLTVDV